MKSRWMEFILSSNRRQGRDGDRNTNRNRSGTDSRRPSESAKMR